MRRIVGSAVLLLVAGLLAGCSASDTSSDTGSRSVADAPQGAAAPQGATAQKAATGEAAVDRQVVTSGSVTIVVANPAGVAQRASEIVESVGGRVDARTELAASDTRSASAHLVVRIPAARLTQTLDQIKDLGHVDQVQLAATDVTAAAKDLDARISALQVSVGRLETLMGSATSSADLLAIESALETRQADLESMQAQRAGIADQVTLATITLDLRTKPAVVHHGPNGFWPGVVAGWDALLATLRGVLIAVGVLLPWAAFLGALAAATLAVIRLVRRRRPAEPAPATTGERPGEEQIPRHPNR